MTEVPTDTLHVEEAGSPDGPALVLLHGFTQTGRLWGEFGERLGAERRLVLVDLPGHAGSAAVRADLPRSAELVLAAAGERGRPVDLLGYSLGGRVALHAALAHPDRVRRLVLIGATGGIDLEAVRAARRAADEALAAELDRAESVDAFVDRWRRSPLFAQLPVTEQDRRERRRNTPAGLASSLRLAGTGTQEPLWARLGGLSLPVLVLAGADDPRFVALGARLAGTLPDAVLSLVPGAGHAAHLHRPAVAARMVATWLGVAPDR